VTLVPHVPGYPAVGSEVSDRSAPRCRPKSRVTAPDSAELADSAAAWRSAYVHIPFCRRRCPYCDFAVVAGDEWTGPVERYVDAVVAEMAMEPAWGPLDAVNLGGGTPTSLSAAQLGRILDALADRFGIAPGAEVSIEANPEDWDPSAWADLVAVGFTRISLGVQSFDPAVLAALGRNHSPAEAATAVGGARRLGFPSVSLDLVFGAAPEGPTSWRNTVDRALSLEPDHLSGYALTVERGTELSRLIGAGTVPAPDPDDQADAYEHLVDAVGGVGLAHYEVSNFARPGHPCRYNMGTWAQGEYLGFGLGAHDHRDGARGRNLRRLDAYLAAVERSERPRAGTDVGDPWAREQERLMLGLRRRAGVVAGAIGDRLAASETGQRLGAAGVLGRRRDRLVVLRPLLTDEVTRAVLDLAPPAPKPMPTSSE
jgi:putative oxygen-independent coproporphyrinogen III oxidase